MRSKYIILFFAVILIGVFIFVKTISQPVRKNSDALYDGSYKVFSSKAEMCDFFSQSYQQTISELYNIKPSSDNLNPSEEWNRATDVINDIGDLCRIDLTDKALRSYKSTILQKYQK